MSRAHAARAHDCQNCGAALRQKPPPNYCPACGQRTTLHPPSVWEFVHEFIGHYVALEGKLWRTLSLLILHPGRLTREYLAGRRQRYVLPLRLYLSASFVFFVVARLISPSGAPQDMVVGKMLQPPGAIATAPADAENRIRNGAAVKLCDEEDATCDRINRWLGPVVQRWRDHPQQAQLELRNRFAASVPYAMFALLPLFAALVALVYRKRRMLYGEHLVFSLHVHTFCFIALLAVIWLPSSAQELIWLVIPLYGLWALRVAYGGSWGATLLRAFFIGASYGLLLCLAVAAGMVYLVTTAG
jgi:hypothetical protein